MEDRVKRVLHIIIGEYLKSPEPVSSGRISQKYGYSSSSIRNWMTELVKDGYLKQIHSSSGRIPTSKALRLYVNELMDVHDAVLGRISKLESDYRKKRAAYDDLIMGIADLMSHIAVTGGYRLAANPGNSIFREIRFKITGAGSVRGIIFAAAGPVRYFEFAPPHKVSEDFLARAADLINGKFRGKVCSAISGELDSALEECISAGREVTGFISACKEHIFDFGGSDESACSIPASNLNEIIDNITTSVLGNEIDLQGF
jgi:heat-inducible transcriptional repressor